MDYIGEALALGIDAVIFGLCCKAYIHCHNAVQSLQSAKIVEINKNLDDLVKSEGDVIRYAAVRGTVKALGSPIKSVNSPALTGVIQRLRVREHVTTRSTTGFWSERLRTIQDAQNAVPFVLRSNKTGVEVTEALTADILDLEIVSDHFEPSSQGVFEHFWAFFTGFRQHGLQSTEELLKEGALMTGIGELRINETGGSARLQPPTDGTPFYLTSQPVSSLVRRFKEQKQFYRMLTLVFGGVALFLMSSMTRRWWLKRIRDESFRREAEQTRKERRQRVRDTNVPEAQLCVVCKQNPRELILLPCGHVCLCEDCGEEVGSICPVCRTDIDTRAPAYLA